MAHFPEANEWFVGIGLIVGYGLVYLLPRKLPRSVSFLMMMLGVTFALGLDHTIGVPPFDFYDTNVYSKLTLPDFFTALLYMPFGYFFAYGYKVLKIKGLLIPLYILAWSLFGIGFEALAVHFHVFTYKGWSIRKSYLVYLFVNTATVVFYHVLMRQLDRLPAG